MKELRKDDIGVQIILVIKNQDGSVVDLSNADPMDIIFNKPDNVVVTKTASLVNDGTDGKLFYATQSGFADTLGIWECQARVTIGLSVLTTTVAKFKVTKKIA